MLSENQVAEIAREIASAKLGRRTVERVVAETTTDSIGRDALRVLIVVQQNKAPHLNGDKLLDTLHELSTKLLTEGESRFPIVEYATDEELGELACPES